MIAVFVCRSSADIVSDMVCTLIGSVERKVVVGEVE